MVTMHTHTHTGIIKELSEPSRCLFVLSAAERKRLELIDKYVELKKNDKIDVYMEKRRKRNSKRDRKFDPYGKRRNFQQQSNRSSSSSSSRKW